MNEFPLLFAFLSETIGLNPESVGSESLSGALTTRMQAARVTTEADYLRVLRNSADELRLLIEAVTVPETWFYRDRGAFEKLKSYAAHAITSNPLRTIRVLSIPCASGEEPYSIAMTLLDAGVPRAQFQIDAVDIRPNAIVRAEAGRYGRNSFRGDDLTFRERYFRPDGANRFAIGKLLQGSVRFAVGNILGPLPFPGDPRYDIVFCRNLLIYFDDRAKKTAAALIRRSLVENGLLFVGHSETIWMSGQEGFSTVLEPHTFALLRSNRAPVVAPPIAKAALKAAPTVPPKTARATPPSPRRVTLPKVPARVAVAVVPAVPAGVDDLLLRARTLANEGKVHEASELAQRALDERGPSSGALFLLGLLLSSTGRIDEADVLLEKAIYLDPQNEEALTYAALIKEQKGQSGAAARLRERARRVHARSSGEHHG